MSNALNKLQLYKDKWEVAKHVFLAVDKAANYPTHAFIPRFEELETDDLRMVASSLISVNVETIKGKAKFMTENVISVSVSPAVAIVLATLLNAEARIAWDWEAFESTITLCEWKWMIAHSTTIPSTATRTIQELRTPVPMIKARGEDENDIEFNVPMVNRFTVLMNGPKAPYADVIAPFRLVQGKHSRKAEKQANYLDLLEELGKMGLTTESDKWRQQQAVTSVLDTMWDSEATIALGSEESRIDRLDEQVNAYYPYNSLLARLVEERQHASVDCQLLNGSDTVTIIGEKERKEVKVLKDFERPITAVFATNCKEFVLKGSRLHVDPTDVDWEGNLLEKKLPEDISSRLRGNVLIRFIFC